jgi:hypothetical protein
MKAQTFPTLAIAALAASIGTLAATPAEAQDSGTTPAVSVQTAQPGSGRVVVERMTDGPVGAPEVRFSDVDGRFGTLLGGYVGWLTDERLFIGGGGSWLVDGSPDRELGYGGIIVEWRVLPAERFRLGVRSLVGGGSATLGATYSELYGYDGTVPTPAPRGRGSRDIHWPDPQTRVLVHEYFFVAEPEVNAQFVVAPWLRVSAGIGYRLIGAASGFEDRLRGISGSVAVQFVGGS